MSNRLKMGPFDCTLQRGDMSAFYWVSGTLIGVNINEFV